MMLLSSATVELFFWKLDFIQHNAIPANYTCADRHSGI